MATSTQGSAASGASETTKGPEPSGPNAMRMVPTRDLRTAFGVMIAAVAGTIAIAAARATNENDVGGYGLAEALPFAYWIAGALAAVGVAFLLSGRRALTWLAIPAYMSVSHLAGAVPHPFARFPVAYTHLGFVRFIEGSGETEVLIDARFAWPGFFAASAGPFSAMSDGAVNMVLRLWPVVIMAIGALLVNRLARQAYPERTEVGMIAALVFLAFSWTGQDYYSPQSVGFIACLGILSLTELGGVRSPRALKGIRSRFTRGYPAPVMGSVGIALAATLLIGLTVVSHPLSPFFIIAGLVVMAVFGRQQAFGLLVITVAVYLGWLAFAAELWWRPRIEDLAAQIGDVLGSLRSSTSDRTGTGTSTSHQRVVFVRILMALALWGWAALEVAFTMAKNRVQDRPLMPVGALAFAPLLAMPLQSYGGELLIRCFFFSSPFAAILAARMIVRATDQRAHVATAALVGVMLVPLMVARFGNESFEMTTAADRAAVEQLYDTVDNPTNTFIASFNAQMPWQDQLRGEAMFAEVGQSVTTDDETRPRTAAEFIARVRERAAETNRQEIRLIVTESQDAFAVHFEAREPGWANEYTLELIEEPGVSVLFNNGPIWVLEIEP